MSYIGTASYYPYLRANASIILNAETGVITCNQLIGNVTADPTDFNQPNVDATFKSLVVANGNLSDASGTWVVYPNGESITVGTQAVRSNAAGERTFYVPDQIDQFGLYDASLTAYNWIMFPDGGARFNADVQMGGKLNVNSDIVCNASVTGTEFQLSGAGGALSRYIADVAFITANTTLNAFKDHNVFLDPAGADLILIIPNADAPLYGQRINITVLDTTGIVGNMAVGTDNPSLYFVGNGGQTAFLNLLNYAQQTIRLECVNMGGDGSYWAF